MKTTMKEGLKRNLDVAMRLGPGLRYNQSTYIVSRDRKRKRVCRGGLGAMGVGQMVEEESDYHRDYPDFETAPEADLPMTWAESLQRSFEEYQSHQPSVP